MKQEKINVSQIFIRLIEDPSVIKDLNLRELEAMVKKLKLDKKIQDKKNKSEYVQVIKEYFDELGKYLSGLDPKDFYDSTGLAEIAYGNEEKTSKSILESLRQLLQELIEKYGPIVVNMIVEALIVYFRTRIGKK